MIISTFDRRLCASRTRRCGRGVSRFRAVYKRSSLVYDFLGAGDSAESGGNRFFRARRLQRLHARAPGMEKIYNVRTKGDWREADPGLCSVYVIPFPRRPECRSFLPTTGTELRSFSVRKCRLDVRSSNVAASLVYPISSLHYLWFASFPLPFVRLWSHVHNSASVAPELRGR